MDINSGACHEGWESCFAYKIDEAGGIIVDDNKLFDPDTVYKK